MKIAVLGAGNGGQAIAAYLALHGNEVNIYNRTYEAIKRIKEIGGIYLEGVLEGFARLNIVSTNVAEVIEDVELIMIVTPAIAHRFLAKELAPFLKDEHKVVLNPGRTGGALEFYNTLRDNNCMANCIIAESQTFIFASRVIGPARAKIFAIKNHVAFAAFPSNRSREVIDLLFRVLPQFSPVENVLKTSLDNIGAIFHPAPTLLNMAWIESTEGNFYYYQQGISPTISNIIEKMDFERMKVAKALGVVPLSASDWLRMSYGARGKDLFELLQNNDQYQGIFAPAYINHRYVLEDVPMSLVPIASIAEHINIETPTINLIIDLANTACARDFRSEGRTVQSLGIQNLSVDELINLVNTGVIGDVKIHPSLNRRIVSKFDNLIYGDFVKLKKGVE
ncbi:NAD/NADP octopine/nopaline dehydrogenase family protein [Natronospora cellulosivora (SeqCode)]